MHYTDVQKMTTLAMQRSEELAQILQQDWEIAAAERAKRLEDKRKKGKSAAGAKSAQPLSAEPKRKAG